MAFTRYVLIFRKGIVKGDKHLILPGRRDLCEERLGQDP
jgi:hypothetical protein